MAEKHKNTPSRTLKSALVKAAGPFMRTHPSPDRVFGELFVDVQRQRIYEDGKTFVDVVPKSRIKHIQLEYKIERENPDFNLQEFVNRHFYQLDTKTSDYVTDPSRTMREHIRALWPVLERQTHKHQGSLIALPHPYIVPGGRFSEQFYWDSYFIMLGLAADGHWDMIDGMMKNYAYMIRKFGFIPTANRTYFLSRSQPPFLSHMVELLEKHKGKRVLVEYLPYLLAEHAFWMKGKSKLTRGGASAYRRVVRMPNGAILNRYYDDDVTPRPESHHEDVTTADHTPEPEKLYTHLRAGAESGWDFSSRWFDDPTDLRTIQTTDIVPVDLNCLLYHLELTIARAYRLLKNAPAKQRFELYAERRARAVQEYCWDEHERFFVDFNTTKQRPTDTVSLAAAFALFTGIATTGQAQLVAGRLENDFLRLGGLVTTLHANGQQWDSPNGWASLQWVAIQGLRNYGHDQLADEIKHRWLTVNETVFRAKGKMIEKYDVVNESGVGGGGEYPLQDGFGWTNGVAAALIDE